MRGLVVLVCAAACGGSASAPPDATRAPDARVPDATPPSPDAAPAGFTPDPVTMGQDLPPVIPVLQVDVGGAQIQLDVDVPGTITVYEQPDATLTNLGPVALTSPIGFAGRGNFTYSLPKKGYSFQFEDGAGNTVDTSLLGLPAGSDFALYACYTDETCLRDALVYAFAQQLGYWNPRTRFVELYIDGAYEGLYMVWERIRRAPTRVDLPKPAASATLGDLTGGYIVRHEGGPQGDGSDFQTTSGTYYRYAYPKITKITPEQESYVQGAWQAMEDDPMATADLPTWVDHAIVEEVTNNWDGYAHSIYMTKEPDAAGGKIGMMPIWDYDLAFGNGNVTGYNCMTNVWAYQIQRGYPDNVPPYWLSMWQDPTFQQQFKCRWQALRADALSDATFDTRIDTWVAFTANARARDQATWPTIGQAIFPNCYSGPTYDDDVSWMRTWIHDRLAWLDAQAAALPGTCP